MYLLIRARLICVGIQIDLHQNWRIETPSYGIAKANSCHMSFGAGIEASKLSLTSGALLGLDSLTNMISLILYSIGVV
jgi:hypothetical protein